MAWSNAVISPTALTGWPSAFSAIRGGGDILRSPVTGHRVLADYSLLVRFPQAAELTVFCGSLVGGCARVPAANAYPAEIFMGDVGRWRSAPPWQQSPR